MSAKRVAILGLGAAGTYAARAATDAGAEVVVYAPFNKAAPPPGAFWLHRLPASVCNEVSTTTISVFADGTEALYRKKQWGTLVSKVPGSSFPARDYSIQGYDPAVALPALLPLSICAINVDRPITDVDALALTRDYDLVLQTFPSQTSMAQQPAYLKYVIARSPIPAPPYENYVLYCGTSETPAVRISQLFGTRFTEFPKGVTKEYIISNYSRSYENYDLIEVRDLHPDTQLWVSGIPRLHFVGRWAEWNKARLSHDVYDIVRNLI